MTLLSLMLSAAVGRVLFLIGALAIGGSVAGGLILRRARLRGVDDLVRLTARGNVQEARVIARNGGVRTIALLRALSGERPDESILVLVFDAVLAGFAMLPLVAGVLSAVLLQSAAPSPETPKAMGSLFAAVSVFAPLSVLAAVVVVHLGRSGSRAMREACFELLEHQLKAEGKKSRPKEGAR
ncbi:MAG: hypothetical protein U1E65_00605 [Myxococcota bacterium]